MTILSPSPIPLYRHSVLLCNSETPLFGHAARDHCIGQPRHVPGKTEQDYSWVQKKVQLSLGSSEGQLEEQGTNSTKIMASVPREHSENAYVYCSQLLWVKATAKCNAPQQLRGLLMETKQSL